MNTPYVYDFYPPCQQDPTAKAFIEQLRQHMNHLCGRVFYPIKAPPYTGNLLRPWWLIDASLLTCTPKTLQAALALECLHMASLTHDDILDKGLLRRGKPSLYAQYGTEESLLLGNAFFLQGLQHAAAAGSFILKIWTWAAHRLVQGARQEIHLRAQHSSALHWGSYQKMVASKTASLFMAACLMGSHFAGLGQKHLYLWQRCGYYLGMTYQMVDDIQDSDSSSDDTITAFVHQNYHRLQTRAKEYFLKARSLRQGAPIYPPPITSGLGQTR